MTATHSRTVQLIRSSGDAICLKIITPPRRGLDRPRLLERVAVSWQQEPRLSTASNSGPSKDRVQRMVNKTSSRITRNNVSLSQTAIGNLPPGPPSLATARSMPDLTAADDNHSAPDHTRRHQNKDMKIGKANDEMHGSPGAEFRDRVLYELTNELRPSAVAVAMQPQVDVSCSVAQQNDNDRTTSESRPETKSADQSTSPPRRPAPPPRGTSLASRLHASSPVVSSLTASRAKSAGSELKELLAVSGHTATSSRTGHEEQSSTNSPSTAARSIISGEHLVLPSQLKKLQRSPTSDHSSKQDTTEGNGTSHSAIKLNGHVGTHHHANSMHRSPVPKRPAPPPPSTKLTAPPATNGEVNFLVMAEQARKQYILSKLASKTLAVEKSSSPSTNNHQRVDAKRANDHGLHKAENCSANAGEMNGITRVTANGKSLEHSRTSNQIKSSPQVDVKGSDAGHPVQQTDKRCSPAESLLLRSAWQLSDSTDTSPTGTPPPIPPKRQPRNNSRVDLSLHNNKTENVERQTTSNVNENGTDATSQSQVSTNEFSTAKLTEISVPNIAQETLHQRDNNDHDRKSNAKLIRGKNVLIRRSGVSRLPSAADYNSAVNDEHSPTSDHKSCEDDEQIQQLKSVCDVGVLPPPPDFAD